MNILVTGGTGFIGSHTVVSLLKSGHQVVILDNLCNSSINILPRLKTITGQEIPFYQGDIRDREILHRIFAENRIDSVIHFAGLKAVGESVAEPMKYYDNNVSGSLVLAEEMARAGVFSIVFSSSATVYGDPGKVPYTEDMPPGDTTGRYHQPLRHIEIDGRTYSHRYSKSRPALERDFIALFQSDWRA